MTLEYITNSTQIKTTSQELESSILMASVYQAMIKKYKHNPTMLEKIKQDYKNNSPLYK